MQQIYTSGVHSHLRIHCHLSVTINYFVDQLHQHTYDSSATTSQFINQSWLSQTNNRTAYVG